MAQILANSRMAALGRRPLCQDTGMVVVFAEVGQDVHVASPHGFADLINEGVRRAYRDPDNPLRASIVADPLGARRNTGDNTPAAVHVTLVPGRTITLTIAAKGGGSENKARFTVLNPGESLADWVLATVPTLGAGWCPPGIIGIGAGGSAEQAMLLAKRALMEPIDIDELADRGAANAEERLRLDLHARINESGIGAQGLGGVTTVLDVKVATAPTHAASLPVALIPQCAADRHVTVVLDGSGAVAIDPPDLRDWPEIPEAAFAPLAARRVNLDTLTAQTVATWKAGETLLLTGTLVTARDAAHRRLAALVERGDPLPVSLAGRVIYYVGPVDPIAGEAVGPAGPTTASRMDGFTELMLGHCGVLAMIGKGERGADATAAIARHGAAYLVAIGGAAYLVSRAVKAARVIAFADLGMEAVHEFDVVDMPVTVAVDTTGQSIHVSGPAEWRKRIAERRIRNAGDITGKVPA
jgi:fumarate hydratase class I